MPQDDGPLFPESDEIQLPPSEPAPRRKGKKFEKELKEYYVSYEDIKKGGLIFVVVAILVVIGIFIVTRPTDWKGKAESMISKAESLGMEAKGVGNAAQSVTEQRLGEARVREAKELLIQSDAKRAFEAATDAARTFQRIIENKEMTIADGVIMDMGGKVEIQRAGNGTWENAKEKMKLFEGDYIKTGSSGVVDLMTPDGTVYRIKPETLYEVHRSQTSGNESRKPTSGGKLVLGQLDMSTGDSTRSVVNTDNATAEVNSRSSVAVDVNQAKDVDIQSFKGSTSVKSQSGAVIVLGERERVVTTREGFSAKERIPDAPVPTIPEDNANLDLKKAQAVSMKWGPVKEATRYHLQIARSRLFIPDSIIVDLPDRQKTDVTLKVTDEGSFFWRVRTLGKGKAISDWSATRRFKVNATGSALPVVRTGPGPKLELARLMPSGNILIVEGRTDPGVNLFVNNEPIDTDATGSFRKTISFDRDGAHTLTFRAVTDDGRETIRREDVTIAAGY